MATAEATLPKHPLRLRIGYKLRRASSQFMAALAGELEEIGLTPTEASILLLIDQRTATTQTEISRELGIKRANMVPLTATLERRELISRRRIDGRSFRLDTTDTGQALTRSALEVMDRHEGRLASLFEEHELAGANAFLDKLNDALTRSR